MRWFRRRPRHIHGETLAEEQEPDDFRPLLAQLCAVCHRFRAKGVVVTDDLVVVDGLTIASALGLCAECINLFRRGDVDGLFARQDVQDWEDDGPESMAAVVRHYREIEA